MPNKNDKTKELILIKQLLQSAKEQIEEATLLFDKISDGALPKEAKGNFSKIKTEAKKLQVLEEGKIIEGIFDGQNMIGPDSHSYPVPPNYASKSKLVEGDIMKLTIMPDGSFVFKQIGPIDRDKVIGTAVLKNDEIKIEARGKLYKVLDASVTYYKISEGDKVTIIIPKKREAKWCAIENVIKKSGSLTKGVEDIAEINGL